MPDEEVIAMYDGSHVPLEQMSDFYGKVKLFLGVLLMCFIIPFYISLHLNV